MGGGVQQLSGQILLATFCSIQFLPLPTPRTVPAMGQFGSFDAEPGRRASITTVLQWPPLQGEITDGLKGACGILIRSNVFRSTLELLLY